MSPTPVNDANRSAGPTALEEARRRLTEGHPIPAHDAWQLAVAAAAEIAAAMARVNPNPEAAEAARMIERAILRLRLGER